MTRCSKCGEIIFEGDPLAYTVSIFMVLGILLFGIWIGAVFVVNVSYEISETGFWFAVGYDSGLITMVLPGIASFFLICSVIGYIDLIRDNPKEGKD